MNPKLLAGLVLAALVGLFLPARASDVGTVYDTLAAQNDHVILVVAIKEAGEVTALKSPTGQWTLFAPPDAAFKGLDDATIGAIATDKKAVQRFVRAHVVMGKYTVADLRKMNGQELKTLSGSALKIEDGKDGLRVGGVKLVPAGMSLCSNGVIHATDAVLPVPKE